MILAVIKKDLKLRHGFKNNLVKPLIKDLDQNGLIKEAFDITSQPWLLHVVNPHLVEIGLCSKLILCAQIIETISYSFLTIAPSFYCD